MQISHFFTATKTCSTNYIGLGLFSNSILGILADIRPWLASKIIFTGHCGVISQCKIMVGYNNIVLATMVKYWLS